MISRQKKINHGMQGVFVFVLLGAFALMSTLMVLLGAQMYRATVSKTQDNNARRVAASYVRSMVRGYDRQDAVTIAQHGETVCVEMRESWDDEVYVMRLYLYEGSLYEQYTQDSYDFDPAMGDAVCAMSGFEPEIKDGALTVALTDSAGETTRVTVALRAAV